MGFNVIALSQKFNKLSLHVAILIMAEAQQASVDGQ